MTLFDEIPADLWPYRASTMESVFVVHLDHTLSLND
jgi:hypothetical protein